MIDLPEGELRERLSTALSVPRWVDEVAGRAPFTDVDALLAAAGRAGASLTADEVDVALERHDLVEGCRRLAQHLQRPHLRQPPRHEVVGGDRAALDGIEAVFPPSAPL